MHIRLDGWDCRAENLDQSKAVWHRDVTRARSLCRIASVDFGCPGYLYQRTLSKSDSWSLSANGCPLPFVVGNVTKSTGCRTFCASKLKPIVVDIVTGKVLTHGNDHGSNTRGYPCPANIVPFAQAVSVTTCDEEMLESVNVPSSADSVLFSVS